MVEIKTKAKGLRCKKINFLFLISIFSIVVVSLLAGCSNIASLEDAKSCGEYSQSYYNRAVKEYKELITINELNTDRGSGIQLHFGLGKLYYEHGDFKQAIEEFKKADFLQAKKFLGISYYRQGDFTDALEVFSKNDGLDDEGMYYYGLICEKLNLYDQAKAGYKKIKSPRYILLAKDRLDSIEKTINPKLINDLDPAAAKIISDAPQAEAYPQAGALILHCDEQIEVLPADKEVDSLHYIIKILNERGKEDFSETHIEYDSTYEKVELEFARTIKPDGSVADVGSRHIRNVSKYLNFPLYSNVRVFIISFPEVSEGAVIEYKVKIYKNKLINKNDFVLHYSLQAQEPVIFANFVLSLPEGKNLNIKMVNEKYNNFLANLAVSLKKENGKVIYNWQFKDIPQIIPEPNMPPNVEVNPAMLFSTFKSWQDIYNWWWNLAKDKIKADEGIKIKVKELIQNEGAEEEKIKAIYNYCAQKIRYVAVEYGQAGYEPHKAEDIFTNKYGDCKDQAVLLVTMLKEAGVQAFLVLIPTKDYYNLNQKFPSVMFNHCIAAVALDGKVVFMDPTAETCPFGDLPAGDQNRQVLIFKEDGYQITTTPLFPAEHNLAEQDIVLKINNDESISAKKSVVTLGVYNQGQRYWLLYTPPQLIEETLKEKIQEVSIGAKLEDYQINNLNNLNVPVTLDYEFKGEEYFTVAGNLRILPQLAGVNVTLAAKEKREFPIDFTILDTKENAIEIDMPDNLKVRYMPENVQEDSPWLRYSVEYKQQGNKVYFSQKNQLKKIIITQEEYPEFKKFFENLAKKIKQRIVLEVKGN
ncbi:MAG: DUF3857 domain-containing protein [Candidatus Omnitrophota bacterium]